MVYFQKIFSKFTWMHLFALWAVQGLYAFAQLVLLPTDSENGILFGFSASRLVGLGVLTIWILTASFLVSMSTRDTEWMKKQLEKLFVSQNGDWVMLVALVVAIGSQSALAVL